jgi:hypothetical protein
MQSLFRQQISRMRGLTEKGDDVVEHEAQLNVPEQCLGDKRHT